MGCVCVRERERERERKREREKGREGQRECVCVAPLFTDMGAAGAFSREPCGLQKDSFLNYFFGWQALQAWSRRHPGLWDQAASAARSRAFWVRECVCDNERERERERQSVCACVYAICL